MQAQQYTGYKYLRFTDFTNLKFWDYYSLSNKNTLEANYPIVKLKEVLHQRKGFISIDDAQIYKRCRVQISGKGVVLRDEIIGKKIKTKKQQLCKTNDFLVAEIDAKVGGYGIVPEKLENAIVSGHYFLFEIDQSKLLPQFLGLIIKLVQFSKQVKATGSTNYASIRPHHVLEYQITLPDLKTQKKLVENYLHLQQQAEEKISQVESDNNIFDSAFNEELQLEYKSEKKVNTGLYFTEYSALSRWDVWNNGRELISKKYGFVPFRSAIIGKPEYGANVKGVNVKTDTRYIRITDINEDGSLKDDIVSAKEVDEKYLLKEGDFLIARSGNTVGKTFLYTNEIGRAIFAGYLIRYKFNLEKVNPLYLLYYTKSKAFKLWIASNQRISGQPNINGQEYLSAPIILPDLKTQERIVQKLNIVRENIKQLKTQAESIKLNAKAEFEKSLFKI